MNSSRSKHSLIISTVLGFIFYIGVSFIWSYILEVYLGPILINYTTTTYLSIYLAGQIFPLSALIWYILKFENESVTKLIYNYKLNWSGFAKYLIIWTIGLSLLKLTEFLLQSSVFYTTFRAGSVWYFLVFVMFFPVQVFTEEFVFRGYLLQRLNSIFGSAQAIIGSALLFAAVHLLNPEVAKFGLILMFLNYFLLGIILGIVATKTKGLEASTALHLANNLFFAIVVNYEGSVFPTPAIWTQTNYSPLGVLALSSATLAYFSFKRINQTK
ncbi:MAG: hypothetical protein OHK0017_13820 [Patescibacteria group bacterium]